MMFRNILVCPKNFCTPKMVHRPKFFWRRGGGGEVVQINHLLKIFLAIVGQNPEKSGKFVSAPLIFSFRYAHVQDLKLHFFAAVPS